MVVTTTNSIEASVAQSTTFLTIGITDQFDVSVAVPFLSGFVEPGESKFWGVPAHVVQAPDGALLVTDEQLGAIYRISYRAPRATKK